MRAESTPAKTRLSLAVVGEQLLCTVTQHVQSQRSIDSFDRERIHTLALDVVSTLERANRAGALSAENLADLRTAGEALWKIALPLSIRTALMQIGRGALLLELDESLVEIPWELLCDGEQFLCRRFDIGRTISNTRNQWSSDGAKSQSIAKLLVIVSDVHGDLPGAAVEGAAILDAFRDHPSASVRVVAARNVEFVRRELKEFDLVHFAGHAEYDPQHAEQTGWLLADGKLSVADLRSLAGGRAMPRIVFSNACQTASRTRLLSAKSAEKSSLSPTLPEAFLRAGVNHFIGTQWEVLDTASKTFATAFYSAIARGFSVGAAVREGRERVVTDDGEGDLGWANYVLYGDPEFVPIVAQLPEITRVPTSSDLQLRQSIRKKSPSEWAKEDAPSAASPEVARTIQKLRAAGTGEEKSLSTRPFASSLRSRNDQSNAKALPNWLWALLGAFVALLAVGLLYLLTKR